MEGVAKVKGTLRRDILTTTYMISTGSMSKALLQKATPNSACIDAPMDCTRPTWHVYKSN